LLLCHPQCIKLTRSTAASTSTLPKTYVLGCRSAAHPFFRNACEPRITRTPGSQSSRWQGLHCDGRLLLRTTTRFLGLAQNVEIATIEYTSLGYLIGGNGTAAAIFSDVVLVLGRSTPLPSAISKVKLNSAARLLTFCEISRNEMNGKQGGGARIAPIFGERPNHVLNIHAQALEEPRTCSVAGLRGECHFGATSSDSRFWPPCLVGVARALLWLRVVEKLSLNLRRLVFGPIYPIRPLDEPPIASPHMCAVWQSRAKVAAIPLIRYFQVFLFTVEQLLNSCCWTLHVRGIRDHACIQWGVPM
jgi:hypothetical protein